MTLEFQCKSVPVIMIVWWISVLSKDDKLLFVGDNIGVRI